MESTNKTTSYNPTPQKIVNTINLDQKQPLIEPTLGKHPNLIDPPQSSMSETGKMGLNNWFQKPVVFQPNLTWATTDNVGTVLFTTTILQVLQSVPTPGYLAMSGNAFFRSGINIDLRVSASPFHAGKLILSYIPAGVDLTYRESVYAKAMFPSVYIDAGNNTHGILHVPFIAIKDYFATQNPDGRSDLGSITVTVLNPLSIGTGGSPQVTYSLAINPTENNLNVPVKSHTVQIQGGMSFPGYHSGLVEALRHEFSSSGLKEFFKDIYDLPHNIKLMGIIRDLEKYSQAASSSGPPPMPIPPSPTPPTPSVDPYVPSGTTNVPIADSSAPSLSNRTGLTSEHMSLTPEESDMHTNAQISDLREMDLKVVARTPSLVQICNYTGTNVVGDRLFLAPITPTLCAGILPVSGTAGNPGLIYPSYLSHSVFPFSFWRGSIDFHFSFAATEQHKGKVLVAYLPHDSVGLGGGATITPLDVTSLSVYPNEVFDLSMNREFTFKVPYNNETEYKDITYPRVLPTDGSVFPFPSNTSSTTGTLVMVVYNRLTYPGTVTPNVQFNVFVSAGEDFEFHGLKDTNFNTFPTSYIQIQSGNDVVYEASLEGMKREKANIVGVSTNLLSHSTFQSDADEMKLNKLLTKYYPQFSYSFNLTANNSKSILITPTPGQIERAPRDTALPDPVFRNLISHYKQLYAFWCGSLNHFVIHNSTVNNPVILSLSHVPNLYNGNTTAYPNATGSTNGALAGFISSNGTTPNTQVDLSLTSLYSHLSNIRVNPTVEITTPHRSKYRRLYPKLVNNNTDTNAVGILYLRYSNPTATDIPVAASVYQSIGDDFRFKYLIPPLSIQVTRNYY